MQGFAHRVAEATNKLFKDESGNEMVQTVVIVGIAALIGLTFYSFADSEALPAVTESVMELLGG